MQPAKNSSAMTALRISRLKKSKVLIDLITQAEAGLIADPRAVDQNGNNLNQALTQHRKDGNNIVMETMNRKRTRTDNQSLRSRMISPGSTSRSIFRKTSLSSIECRIILKLLR